jgi:DNA invertase Pin-like site-specific DNA recombinase
MTRAAIYARVSTRDQHTANQTAQLKEYCGRAGYDLVAIYADNETGRTSDRPQFRRMFEDAGRRHFERLVVWSLDRFSREGIEQTFAHIRQLRSFGVDIESYQEPLFRTAGPAGELFLALAAWIAERETHRRAERVKAGQERARQAGRHIGRRPALTPDQISTLRQNHANGKSLSELARQFQIGRTTVSRHLKPTSTHTDERREST